MNQTTRRQFARAAGLFSALSYRRIQGANDRVRMGFIGLGNRGDQVHDAFLEHGDSVTAAVCDLREDYLDFAVKKSRATPRRYGDYRRLLEDKEIDAVAIATPDHWHALMFVDACHAGKDVYVEKPLCLTVFEGRRMVDTAAATRRVSQVGIHRRSVKALQEAAALVRGGAIGQVTVAKGFNLTNEWPTGIGAPPDTTPPSAAQWDAWLGPAPKVPYNANRTFYNFRWFFGYSGGQLTNWGVHYIDMMRWCFGGESPRMVTAMGGRYAVKDNREIPDTLEVLWEYPAAQGTVLVTFSQYNANGAPGAPTAPEMEIRGTLGTMYLSSGKWEIVPDKHTEQANPARTPLDRNVEKGYNPSKKATIAPRQGQSSTDTAFHARNFLDCVKSRAKCNCDILDGHLSTSATQIANIALKLKSQLEWDAKAERFPHNDPANKYLSYQYRAPYKLS